MAEKLLLVLLILAPFFLGYYVVDRMGKVMDDNSIHHHPLSSDKKMYQFMINDRSSDAALRKVNRIVHTLTKHDECILIICSPIDSRVIETLKESGYVIESESR